MEAAQRDYTVESGDCLKMHVRLYANDANGDPQLMNLAGYSSEIVFTWDRWQKNGGSSLTLSTADDTLDITDADSPSTAEIMGVVTKDQTPLFPEGKLTSYQWSVTGPDGCKQTFLEGKVLRK